MQAYTFTYNHFFVLFFVDWKFDNSSFIFFFCVQLFWLSLKEGVFYGGGGGAGEAELFELRGT